MRVNRTWLLLGSIGIVAAVIACLVMALVGGLRFFQQSQAEAEPALRVVEQFIAAGARNDAPTGFALFDATLAEPVVTQADVARLYTQRREVFQDVRTVTQDGFRIQRATDGTTALLTGTISYGAAPVKRFTAQLRQSNGAWRLTRIDFADSLGQ